MLCIEYVQGYAIESLSSFYAPSRTTQHRLEEPYKIMYIYMPTNIIDT